MVNIIFDECISIKMINKIRELINYHPAQVNIHHLQDYYKKSTKDIEWLSNINNEWLIITSDRGINSKKQEDKLPIICKQRDIRCVIISQGIHKRRQFYKAVAILYCWDEILKLIMEPKGVQYKLRLTAELKPKLELKYSPINSNKNTVGITAKHQTQIN